MRKRIAYALGALAGAEALWKGRLIPCRYGQHLTKIEIGKRGVYLHCRICALTMEIENMH